MKKKVLLVLVAILAMGQSAFAYDFSAVSPSGHTLYYKIIDPVNHYVKVTYPNDDQVGDHVWFGPLSASETWGSIPRPIGALVIPDTVAYGGTTYIVRSIGSYAFCDCPFITSVVMPNTVDSLGGCAFRLCVNLTSITLSNSLRYICENALSECHLGDVVLPSSVRVLKEGALRNSYITNITLNDSLERLEHVCLADNPFVSLYIPASVNYIYDPCQYHRNLSSIIVDPNNPYYDSRNNCNAIIETGTNKLIQGCNSTIIPDGIVTFDDWPFFGCSFETLVVPSSVILMGFRECHINKLVLSSPIFGSMHGGSIDTIQFLNQIPPDYLATCMDWLNDIGIYEKPIIVPCGTISAYQSAPNWSNCTNMMEYEAPQIAVNAENGSASVVTYPTCTNDTATVSATADSNYHFVGWSDGSTQNPYTLVLNGNTTLTALFAIDSVNVTATANPLKGVVLGGGTVPLGGTATLTAIPSGNNIFLSWSNGVTENPYTLTVTADTALQALFTLPDTLIFRDTTYINHYIHDTTFVNNYVHDTTIQYVNQYVHDTTFVNNYVHDTTIQYVNQYVHDTTFINNYVHDTVRLTTYVFDTTIVNHYQYDTAIHNQYSYDTTIVNLSQYDTTLTYVYDTTIINVYDTTIINNFQFDTMIFNTYTYDTVFISTRFYDTIYVHDTVYITEEGIDGVETLNAKVYSNRGQIVVEGADGNRVTLYDVTGRVLATRRDEGMPLRFDAPVSGTYLIKIGSYPARRVVVIR